MIDIRTNLREWNEYWDHIKSIYEKSRLEISTGENTVHGFRSPDRNHLRFRDNIYMLPVTVYLDSSPRSLVDFILGTQSSNGAYMDYLDLDGSVRECPLTPDMQYLAVYAAFHAWLASGDNEWLSSILPKLQLGLDHLHINPDTWDEKTDLPKRPFTIDMWDFDYRGNLSELHWPGKIDEETKFGIMHGDVSGLYQAYELMSIMLHSLDRVDDAGGFHLLKNDLRHLANRILFMDAHYIHRLPLDGKFLDSIHEDEQLSISNLFSVNRGLPDPHQSRLIVREYYRRRNLVKTFVEWYAIEPGFPAGTFGDDKMEPGMYVNGGLLPIAGGELALASIKYGYPDYGAHILQRYFTMIDKTGESWFWYGPRGKPPDDFTASWFDGWKYDCWGASSMMNALIQSMAGVRCERPGYSQVWLEPHWNITGVIDAEVTMEFEESGDRFHYLYKYDEDKKRTRIEINSENLRTLYIAVSDALESYTIESAGKTLNGEIIIRDYSRAIEVEVESGHEIKIEIMES